MQEVERAHTQSKGSSYRMARECQKLQEDKQMAICGLAKLFHNLRKRSTLLSKSQSGDLRKRAVIV